MSLINLSKNSFCGIYLEKLESTANELIANSTEKSEIN